MAAELAVEGDLEVDAAGVSIRVVGDGDRLLVDVPTLTAALKLRRWRPAFDPLWRVLGRTGLRAEVAVDGVRVATVDPAVAPGLLASLLGVAPVRPSLLGLVRVVATRR